MRGKSTVLVGSVILTFLIGLAEVAGQSQQGQGPKRPFDEEKQILREIEKAYQAPEQIDALIYKSLSRAYQRQTPEQEQRVLRTIRRVYQPTKDQEDSILREIRRSYNDPSQKQVEQIFRAIHQSEKLPRGTVSPDLQAEQPLRSFGRFDRDADGQLSLVEMSDLLRGELAVWDTDHDGLINTEEYAAFYQARFKTLAARVALEEFQAGGGIIQGEDMPRRPNVYRAGQLPPGLPGWFTELDTDGDAQLGFYEWRKSGRSVDEFNRIDRNGDGFLTTVEVLRHVAQQSPKTEPQRPRKQDTSKRQE